MLANDIMQVLLSSGLKSVLERAIDSMDDETSRPISVKEFLDELWNALITSFLVRSLRRAQEFTEFTIGEWNNRSKVDDGAIVNIKKTQNLEFWNCRARPQQDRGAGTGGVRRVCKASNYTVYRRSVPRVYFFGET